MYPSFAPVQHTSDYTNLCTSAASMCHLLCSCTWIAYRCHYTQHYTSATYTCYYTLLLHVCIMCQHTHIYTCAACTSSHYTPSSDEKPFGLYGVWSLHQPSSYQCEPFNMLFTSKVFVIEECYVFMYEIFHI